MPQYNYQTGQMEETDEERRIREEAEKAAGSTVVGETRVKQYQDGSQTETVTKEIAAPVAPDNTFNRMMQVESGGRQTNAQGQVLTSPKGALGVAQVMPTTAMDPGYGVPNIFDLAQQRGVAFQNRDRATAEQLLGNRALNQEFGQNYYAAMNRRFDGGPAAVAAYNAGPGRVQQNMAQNQGQLNVGQLPQETQGYLQKVGMPAPQAQPRPPQPVSPQQLAQQPMPANQGINPPAPALQIPGLTPVTQMPSPSAQAIDRYQAIQDRPDELMKFAFNPSTPAYLQQRAKDQIAESYDSQKKESQAQTALNTMSQNEIARTLTKKSEGNSVGDWAQYLLFKHVGLTDLANQKAEQLGIGHQWTRSMITDNAGNDIPVEIQTTASGKLLGGNMLDGTPLTRAQLNQTGTSLGKGTTLTADVYVDPKTGNRYSRGNDSSGRVALVNIQGGPAYRGDPKNLVLQSIGTAQARADIGLVTDLKKKHGNNVLDAEKDYVTINGPFKTAADRAEFRQAYGFGLAQPAGMPTPAPGSQTVQGAPGAPAGQAPAPAGMATLAPAPSNVNVPLGEQQQTLEAQKDIKKKQASNAYQARQIAPFVAQIKELIPKTTSSGVGTAVDAAGRLIGVSNEGADAIAAIAPLADKILKTVERFEGPQSNIDVDSYKEASGKLSDPTVPVAQKKAAFATIIEILKRNAPDINWTEALMTKEDKAAMKWATANPNDPRSKEIKKRFEQ